MKKLSLLLAVCIVMLTLLSCQQQGAVSDISNVTTAQETTAVTEPEDTRVYADLPDDTDFGGVNITVVNIDYSIPIWTQRDIYAEELTGEIINDAVYQRNSTVQEALNCAIVSNPLLDYTTYIRKAVQAADGSIDLATVALKSFAVMAGEGLLVELRQLEHMDLSKPWYDQSSIECLSVANKLYGVCSDYTIMDNDSTTAMVFNKQMHADYGLDDPYEIAENGEWTLGELIKMSKNVSADVNGDGVYDDNDRYGLLYQRDTMSSFYNGLGCMIADKDADDLPVMAMNNEHTMSVLDKLYDYLYDEQTCFHVMKFFDPTAEGFTNGMTRMFQSNSALFMWIRMADIENLRTMEVDFGILPIPKLDANQERYYHSVNPYVGAAVIVPKCSPDLERTGIFIEAISAESKYTLQPVYYDVMLNAKLTRDEESSGILDIIFTSRIFDIGEIYDFGGIGYELIYMTMTYNRDMASKYASKEKAISSAITKVIEQYTGDGN